MPNMTARQNPRLGAAQLTRGRLAVLLACVAVNVAGGCSSSTAGSPATSASTPSAPGSSPSSPMSTSPAPSSSTTSTAPADRVSTAEFLTRSDLGAGFKAPHPPIVKAGNRGIASPGTKQIFGCMEVVTAVPAEQFRDVHSTGYYTLTNSAKYFNFTEVVFHMRSPQAVRKLGLYMDRKLAVCTHPKVTTLKGVGPELSKASGGEEPTSCDAARVYSDLSSRRSGKPNSINLINVVTYLVAKDNRLAYVQYFGTLFASDPTIQLSITGKICNRLSS